METCYSRTNSGPQIEPNTVHAKNCTLLRPVGWGGSVGSVEPPRPSKLVPLAQAGSACLSWFRLPSLVPLAVAGSASFRLP